VTPQPAQLLVALAEFDPGAARLGDWLNLLEGLHQLAGRPVDADIPDNLHVLMADLGSIQAELRRFVHQLVAEQQHDEPIEFPVTIHVGFDHRRLVVTGALRDCVLTMASLVIITPSRSPIARCPEDGRLFVRYRRQRYCSRRCVNRVNLRAVRARRAAESID
jgi:hypothetical protein